MNASVTDRHSRGSLRRLLSLVAVTATLFVGSAAQASSVSEPVTALVRGAALVPKSVRRCGTRRHRTPSRAHQTARAARARRSRRVDRVHLHLSAEERGSGRVQRIDATGDDGPNSGPRIERKTMTIRMR